MFTGIVAWGQSATASLGGAATDERGAAIANASVTITDAAKAVSRKAATGGDGLFTAPQLPPSRYKIKVDQSGFATAELPEIVLNVGEQASVRIHMKVAQVGEVVTISDVSVVGDSPAVATIVDRQFVENQPLNGRSFQTLVKLSPGVVVTPSNLVTPGQFSVNGQRAGSNYFTVDGVSANFGSTASTTLHVQPAGGMAVFDSTGFGNGVTDELHSYPQGELKNMLDERIVELSYVAGHGIPAGARPLQMRDGSHVEMKGRDRLAELVAVPVMNFQSMLWGLLIAALLGAMHAMSPGHRKTVVGAYLVGSHGTARHAAFLGLTVTITHTAGVFALGLLTMAGSQYLLPEKLFPILSILSGLLVVFIGLSQILRRLRRWLDADTGERKSSMCTN